MWSTSRFHRCQGCTSLVNLNSIAHALKNAPRATGLEVDALNELSIYWEAVRQYYSPFDTSPPFGTAEVFDHQMPVRSVYELRESKQPLLAWGNATRCGQNLPRGERFTWRYS